MPPMLFAIKRGVYSFYFVIIDLYSIGSLLLFYAHESHYHYKEAVTNYLSGGEFLFHLLGSPDPQYGNKRHHILRTRVVPVMILGRALSVQLIRFSIVLINRFS